MATNVRPTAAQTGIPAPRTGTTVPGTGTPTQREPSVPAFETSRQRWTGYVAAITRIALG